MSDAVATAVMDVARVVAAGESECDLLVLLSNGEHSPACNAVCSVRRAGDRSDSVELRSPTGMFDFPEDWVVVDYAVHHRHGVMHRGSRGSTQEKRTIVLAAAGAIVVHAQMGRFAVEVVRKGGKPDVMRVSGAQGEAVCGGVPVEWGPVRVRVIALGGIVAEFDAVDVRPGEDTIVSVPVGAGCRVSGVVVDPSGAPLRGVFVNIVPSDGVGSRRIGRSMTTGANGYFELEDVAARAMAMSLSRPGYGSRAVAVDCRSGRDIDLGRLVLEQGATVSGYVTSGGVRVTKVPGGLPDMDVGCTPAKTMSDVLSNPRLTMYQRARVGKDGSFELRGIDKGTHVLWVAPRGRGAQSSWHGRLVEVGGDSITGLVLEASFARACVFTLPSLGSLGGNARLCAMGALELWSSNVPVEGGAVTVPVGAGPFLVGAWIGGDHRWLQWSLGMTESAAISLPSAKVVLDRSHVMSGGEGDAGLVTLTYLEGQFGSEVLPLVVRCRQPRVDEAQYTVDWLMPGTYRFIVESGQGQHALEFRVGEGETLYRRWPSSGH